MKVLLSIAFLVCLAVIYSQTDAQIIVCPDENDENVTLIAHPTNCNSYFACESGEAIPMKCPKGLHFNPKLSVCDWPRNVKCKGKP